MKIMLSEKSKAGDFHTSIYVKSSINLWAFDRTELKFKCLISRKFKKVWTWIVN